MAWSTIRRATMDDEARLLAAASRFATRHRLFPPGRVATLIDCLDVAYGAGIIEPGCSAQDRIRATRLRRLWLACVRRALREPHAEGIAYGQVGYHVK